MRLWAVLNALIFRGISRIVPNTDQELQIRLGVRSLLRLFRSEIQLNMLPSGLENWARFAAVWQKGGLDEKQLHRIWTGTRGGVGARDIWDLACGVAGVGNTEDAFIAMSALPAIAAVAIGGAYGASVAVSLKKSAERHLPEVLVSADQLEDAARAYVSGAPISTKEMAQRYLMQLTLGMGVEIGALYAGVTNHFLRWCGESSSLESATYESVVREMTVRGPQTRAYLASCEKAEKVRVRHGGRDEESEITLSVVGSRCMENAKVDGGIVAMARYAENLWETSVQLHIE
ncbi:MAG: hypothetical protein CL454_00905 [Acidimicrobiaceae bacterium]|nr:hypothetical protein [Acidimicrobiaceae bacterium]